MSGSEPERLVEVTRELFYAGGEWNYVETVAFSEGAVAACGADVGLTLSVGAATPAEAVRRAFAASGGGGRGRVFELFSDAEISRAVVDREA